jgi:hypothetical protein
MSILGLVALGRDADPAIVRTFEEQVPGAEVITACALDGWTREDVISLDEPEGEYPIFMTVRGDPVRHVCVPLARLAPRVPQCIAALASRGAEAIALTCAGEFTGLEAPVPLLVPSGIFPQILRSTLPTRRVGVVTPNQGQADAALLKWRREGYDPVVLAVPPAGSGLMTPDLWSAAAEQFAAAKVEAVAIDCFGFDRRDGLVLHELTGTPVVVVREVTARAAGAFLSRLAA